jgi:hypothetical protein
MITNYTQKKEGGVFTISGQVLIQGGANIMAYGKTAAMITPKGIATPITKKEKEILDINESFKLMTEAGYMHYSEKKEDAEKVAKDMEDKDNSSPVLKAGAVRGGKKQTQQKGIIDAQEAAE